MHAKPGPDRIVAQIAARQHGVVARSQLLWAGIGRGGISHRVRAGRLHRVHRGVYTVGHRLLSFEGRCLAAVLACDPRTDSLAHRSATEAHSPATALSHSSAAALWGMLPAPTGAIHVSLLGRAGRAHRTAIVLHRPTTLTEDEVTRRHGVPVTRPARTLRDLRRVASTEVHQRAVRRALDLDLVREEDLGDEPDLTRSELERLFLGLCRRRRLPTPEVNVRVGSFEVDFLWRTHRVIAETDCFRHHSHREAFERDRARDAALQGLGYRVLRFTYRQVRERPDRVAAQLRAVLVG